MQAAVILNLCLQKGGLGRKRRGYMCSPNMSLSFVAIHLNHAHIMVKTYMYLFLSDAFFMLHHNI